MEHQLECEFIVLAYASDAIREDDCPIAIAARELGPDRSRGLMLHVPAVLGTSLRKRHLDYLHELFESWRELANDQLEALFRELRELGTGPLRTREVGYCSIGELPRLVNQVLGANEQFNESPGRTHG
jgi:hypothetical protein